MKILTICREIPSKIKTHNYNIAEFVFEQNKALNKLGVEFEYYLIKKGGVKGYLYHTFDFLKFLKDKKYSYDLIHAHGGHFGSLANLQRRIPVITTYHGSDINILSNRMLSFVALVLSKKNIFVSSNLLKKVRLFANGKVIPCGIDFDVFKPANPILCRKELNLDLNKQIVLFAGQKDRSVKNYKLAKEVTDIVGINNVIELKGYNRKEVAKLINACNCLLLTSFSEGSPMVIKEALACNCPIVSVDVGDIKQITKGVEGVFISDHNKNKIAHNLIKALNFEKINSREKIKFLDNKVIAQKIYNIYSEIIKNV